MSQLTLEEATKFFTYLETSKDGVRDGKITKSDLENAVAVDTDGDGYITDKPQKRKILQADGTTIETTWTEKEIVAKNVAQWTKNAGDKWKNDEKIDLEEFLEMVGVKSP